MSKRSGSEKRKAKAARLGLPLHQVEKMEGRSRAMRRAKLAQKLGISSASIREEERRILPEERINLLKPGSVFPFSEEYVKAISGSHQWNTDLWGRLKGTLTDNPQDYRTMLGQELKKVDIKETHWSQLSRGHVLLGQFEEEFAGKLRSRSKYFAKDFLAILVNWNSRIKLSHEDLIVKAFMRIEEKMSSLEFSWKEPDIVDIISKLDKHTSAGYPWLVSKVATLSDTDRKSVGLMPLEEKYKTEPELLSKIRVAQSSVTQELPTLLTKFEERETDVLAGNKPRIVNITGLRTESAALKEQGKRPFKQRLVWNVPYDYILFEKKYGYNFMRGILSGNEGFSQHMWTALNRRGEVKRGIPRLLDMIAQAQSWGTQCISLDYSAFDQHIAPFLEEQVIRIMSKFTPWPDHVKEYLLYGTAFSELWTGWGVLNRDGGIPSGSYFTNLFDSIINAAVCEAVGITVGGNIDYLVNGDDACFICSKEVSLETIEIVASMFGMEANKEKQWTHPSTFWFNKTIVSPSLGGETRILHRVLNTLMRHDQRKRILIGVSELAALFQELVDISNHPYKEVFLTWLVEVTLEDDGGSRFNPEMYMGQLLPAYQGHWNVQTEEVDSRPVESFRDKWFWPILCSYKPTKNMESEE